MKKKIMMLLLMTTVITGGLWAADGFSAGFELGELGGDLLVGGRLTTPFILDGHAAARFSGDVVFAGDSWAPYGYLRLGVVGTAGLVNGFARFYGEGGPALLLNEPGSGSLSFCGYGLFGFEFLTAEDGCVSYFIEMGTLGTAVGRLNGFNVRTGLEVYF